jgi:16S rRNA (guanine966-N2)-methyltransferase
MRIIAGTLRGLTLAPVGKGDEAAHLRPTTDRVRESIFNVLMGGAHGDPIRGKEVLDLFAGTGALGFEALSRGAANVTFVDDGTKARALIRRNIDLTRTQGSTKLFRRDATKLGDRHGRRAELVFLDPPYGMGLGEKAIAAALDGDWLAPGAIIVWEENRPPEIPPGLRLRDQRKYGDTIVSILERVA